MNNTVLVFDPDRMVRRATLSALRYGNFDTDTARNTREASRLLRRHRYAAIVVDPDTESSSGEAVSALSALTTAPIIVVSTRGDRENKVALLDAGADDYLVVPFDPEELLARVRAVVRRASRVEEELPIVTDDFTIYLHDRRLVRRDGEEPALSPTEWRVLEVLVQHAGHLVTREELLTSVWGPQAVDKTQYLRVHMASIRHKVEPDPPHPRYLITVPGLGLKFTPSAARMRGADAEVATQGDHGPDRLDDAEGPGAAQEAVRARECAAEREHGDEARVAIFEGVHDHHEGDDGDAVERQHRASGPRQHPAKPGPTRVNNA